MSVADPSPGTRRLRRARDLVLITDGRPTDPLDANDLHGGRCRSFMQVEGPSRSYTVDRGWQGCCTLPLHSAGYLTI
jgi:hypothetical protein